MEQQKQMNMDDFLSVQESDHEPQVDRKSSTDVNKTVDKKNAVIKSRISVCIVRR